MFVGRTEELEALEDMYSSGRFEMMVLYGRRRVGKTSLIDEFSKDKRTFYFTASQKSTKLNLEVFSRQMSSFFDMPELPAFTDWRSAFEFFVGLTRNSQSAGNGHFVFVFDEFPYAAQADPTLPSTLQTAIDHGFKDTSVMMILSGSNQGFMESEVLGGKSPLYGRRTGQIRLEPFDYYDAAKFLPNVSNEERVQYYATFGGTPYYLARLRPSRGFKRNVADLMFRKSGLLYEEPMMLLREETREPASYFSVLQAVANGSSTPKRIAEHAGVEASSVARYLNSLVDLGLVERKLPFGDNPQKSHKGMYVIADPFFAFWFRFVGTNVDVIENGKGPETAEETTSGEAFATYVGQQFENICLQWVARHSGTLDLPFRATRFGKWWGNNPVAREQTDIDVVAANGRGQLLIGECKWRNTFDVTEAIDKLQGRVGLVPGFKPASTRLALFSKRPVAKTVRAKIGRDAPGLLFFSTDDLYRK
ncbi:ATP-binding protein [Bifidobacterium sp. ESL0690]|uniref:ATP-binding protein n=1 Tax=Bifidobacterium sp. ESL0690 TaxID=2983214 RepID=UPI0023F9734E|nr:ATP-binding protein [Bifidobacterium sp. ESL0690]WEV46728.1 ATP-binding protein [Bifidobacterium sp. ESL0690]